MRIAKKQIADALGVDWNVSSNDISIALKNIETIIDTVAEGIDNDFESAALGDASNIIQVIRERLNF